MWSCSSFPQEVQWAAGAHSAQQRLRKPWTLLFTCPKKTNLQLCSFTLHKNRQHHPSLNLRANSDFILTEKLGRKLHMYKHPVVCTRQQGIIFHKTLSRLSIIGILLWVTICLKENVVRSSLQHCRVELTHLYWICSFSPKQRQGWEKWLISTSVITWSRYAQGVTHLKKSESNLRQTHYIVKSPSFSVFWECSPWILIFFSFLFIWNYLMSLFSEKISLDLQTAHCTHSRLDLYCIPSMLSQGLSAPLLSVQGLKVWEQWKSCVSNPEFALYEYS